LQLGRTKGAVSSEPGTPFLSGVERTKVLFLAFLSLFLLFSLLLPFFLSFALLFFPLFFLVVLQGASAEGRKNAAQVTAGLSVLGQDELGSTPPLSSLGEERPAGFPFQKEKRKKEKKKEKDTMMAYYSSDDSEEEEEFSWDPNEHIDAILEASDEGTRENLKLELLEKFLTLRHPVVSSKLSAFMESEGMVADLVGFVTRVGENSEKDDELSPVQRLNRIVDDPEFDNETRRSFNVMSLFSSHSSEFHDFAANHLEEICEFFCHSSSFLPPPRPSSALPATAIGVFGLSLFWRRCCARFLPAFTVAVRRSPHCTSRFPARLGSRLSFSA
jgi:hypothetical protein